ncbi:hypothetical protein UFOVP1_17 [uncultured Caudovirales phage]|uniref:Uncharacterized protein n=1 Tax=uncultured Caudovirales phage TaxID=2100421 RepID=A0A6J5KH78_9CAUD|nr:hypothetical protein UFOVP1_17 [uncultured Caudovirales phage]
MRAIVFSKDVNRIELDHFTDETTIIFNDCSYISHNGLRLITGVDYSTISHGYGGGYAT